MNDKIQCLLCNNFYGTIVSSHLERRHKISKVDYLKRFPDARLFSEKYSANRKKVFLDVIKNNPDICSKAGKKGIISTNKYLHGVYRKRFPEKYHAHHIKVGKITGEKRRLESNLRYMYRNYDEENRNKVQCLICYKFYHTIHIGSRGHLKRKHNISKGEYLNKFPTAKLFSGHYSSSRKNVAISMIKNNPNMLSEMGKKSILERLKNTPYIYKGHMFLSKEEMLCFQHLETLVSIVKTNVEVNNFFFDFLLNNRIFLEYHPINFYYKIETIEQYYNRRRQILNENGYPEDKYPLIVVQSLKELKSAVEVIR